MVMVAPKLTHVFVVLKNKMCLIAPDKNIGIIFQARSGSTVLQYYLSVVTRRVNMGELFNLVHPIGPQASPAIDPADFDNDDWKVHIPPKETDRNDNNGKKLFESMEGMLKINKRIQIIQNLNKLNKQVIFKILLKSYLNMDISAVKSRFNPPLASDTFSDPTISERLKQETNTQFINLARADYFQALLSYFIAVRTDLWHLLSDRSASRPTLDKKLVYPIRLFNAFLNDHIIETDHMKQYFPNIQTIYYEQFQYNIANLRNLFTGIPKQIISIPTVRFIGDHRDSFENIDEIEDIYKQFVNEHKEYFPQYFDKTLNAQISAFCGKQSTPLSVA